MEVLNLLDSAPYQTLVYDILRYIQINIKCIFFPFTKITVTHVR